MRAAKIPPRVVGTGLRPARDASSARISPEMHMPKYCAGPGLRSIIPASQSA
jgi:hypothetical protein